jgi:hypothetical protein
MKTKCQATSIVIALFSASLSGFGIENLKITVQCPDVVLSWPSQAGETYIVQYRPTLNTNTPWMTLTNNLPAATGTNWTSFIHANVIADCPPPEAPAGGGAQAASSWTSMSEEERVARRAELRKRAEAMAEYLMAMLREAVARAQAQRERWAREGRPTPHAAPSQAQLDSPQAAESQSVPNAGFYRVVRNGVHLIGLTNGTALSGIVPVVFEAGYDQGSLSSVTLSANGTAIEGTSMVAPPFSQPPAFLFDTRRLNNGSYSLQAAGMWLIPTTNVYDPGYIQSYSPSVSVNIYNSIFYPDWVQEYRADLLLMKLRSAQANVDWQIDVYGGAGDYVGSFADHSADGVIDFAWDLRDPNGVPRNDNTFTTVTSVTPSGFAPAAAAVQTNPPLIRVVDTYPDDGKWIVARSDYIPSGVENYDLYVDTVNAFAQMGEVGGGVLPGAPYRPEGEALFLFQGEGGTNSAALYRAFTNRAVRNFYFDGHGGPDFFGYGYDTNGARRTFSSGLIASAIGNTTPGTNATRYRWVWIDSCSSALGSWPQTFAMGNRENVPLTSYTSRPAAFCGFDRDVYGWTPGHNRVAINSINYRSYFLLYWSAFEFPLKISFDFAASDSGFPDAQFLKVYGYWGMHWNEFNTNTEWP